MARARDSQRKKFTLAWRGFERSVTQDELDLDECVRFVNRVIHSRWWRQRVRDDLRYSHVKDGRGRRTPSSWLGTNAQRQRGIVLTLPTGWPRTKTNILLLLAYHGIPSESAWHSRETARLVLDMVSRFMDRDTATLLRESFVQHKVRHRAKPTYSDDGLINLRETGYALADSKAERAIAKLEADYRV